MAHARPSRYAAYIAVLLLVHLAATPALASGVAEMRERLLAADTPEAERAPLVQLLIAEGEDGQAVLREVLRGPREDLVRIVVRFVLIGAVEPLLEDVLVHVTKSDLEDYGSARLIQALAKLAADTGRSSATRALLAIGTVRSREAVEALLDLWETNVPGARQSLLNILPKDFESAAEARAWWAEQGGKSLLEIVTEMVRPPDETESIEKRMGRLIAEHLERMRAILPGASAEFVARYFLSDSVREVRKLGAGYFKEHRDLKPEEAPVVAGAIVAALSLEDEEKGTLVEMLDAARIHAAALHGLPDSRAREIVETLLGRPEREVRERCIDLLGDLGDADASEALERLYDGNGGVDAALRSRIISALTRIGNGVAPWANTKLTEQLDLEAGFDRDITGKLINLLGKRGTSQDVSVLARVLEKVEDEDLRGFAAWALGEAGIKRGGSDPGPAIRLLTRLGLKNASPGVRLKAASALQNAKGSEAAVDALAEQLSADDNPAVLGQVARSLQVIEGAMAAARLAPHVARDPGIAAILDEAIEAALSEAKLLVLLKTAEALAVSDPDRAIAVCGKIRGKSWPPESVAEVAKVDLLLARAYVTKGDARKALEVLDAMRKDAPVDPIDRLLVRAHALRLAGRAAEGLKLVETALAGETPAVEKEFALRIEQVESFIAMDRLDEALEAHGLLTSRDRLTEANKATLEALGVRISEARGAGAARAARIEGIVTAWLDGAGGEDAMKKVLELGPRAYPLLRARLEKLTDTEAPALTDFLGKLRALTGKDFGFTVAETPEARTAARQQWLDALR